MKFIGYKKDKNSNSKYPNSKYLIALTQQAKQQISAITDKFYSKRETFHATDIWYRMLIQELMVLSRLGKNSWKKLNTKTYIYTIDGIGCAVFSAKKICKTKIITILMFAFRADLMSDSEFAEQYLNFDSAYNSCDKNVTPQNIKNEITYKEIKNQPYSQYDLTVVKGKQDKKIVYNFKYDNVLVSKDPITIIKSMNKKEPYGKYKLVAYCCIRGMMYGLSSDGKLYNSNRNWKDCYTESLFTPTDCTRLITEYFQEIKADKMYNQIMNNFYESLTSLIYD